MTIYTYDTINDAALDIIQSAIADGYSIDRNQPTPTRDHFKVTLSKSINAVDLQLKISVKFNATDCMFEHTLYVQGEPHQRSCIKLYMIDKQTYTDDRRDIAISKSKSQPQFKHLSDYIKHHSNDVFMSRFI